MSELMPMRLQEPTEMQRKVGCIHTGRDGGQTYLLYCNSPWWRLATQWGPIATPQLPILRHFSSVFPFFASSRGHFRVPLQLLMRAHLPHSYWGVSIQGWRTDSTCGILAGKIKGEKGSSGFHCLKDAIQHLLWAVLTTPSFSKLLTRSRKCTHHWPSTQLILGQPTEKDELKYKSAAVDLQRICHELPGK